MTTPPHLETLVDAVEHGLTSNPDGHLVVVSSQMPHTSSLAALHRDARAFAAWLRAIGVSRGDVVAIQRLRTYQVPR
jgi:acyl-CoA synthetase (AMP-forming)/AMP-acid ligase II